MSLDSSFGYLLTTSLTEWCDIGQYAGRRLDDLLFNEYDPTTDGDFSGWFAAAQYAGMQPGVEGASSSCGSGCGGESSPVGAFVPFVRGESSPACAGEPVPPHRILVWPLLIIQAAIYSREPERIARMLACEVDEYELDHIAANEWVDLDGNPAPLPADDIQAIQLAAMNWPANWRRTFGTTRH